MKCMVYIMTLLLLMGCASKDNMVTVRQIENDNPVVLRINEERERIFSLKYPLSFEFKKNNRGEIYYFESSYFPSNEELCPGTGESHLKASDNDDYLAYRFKRFDGGVLYTIEENDTIQKELSDYLKRMNAEKKDTVHIPVKSFREKHGKLIEDWFEGDTIILHFHDHKQWHDIPQEVDFFIYR